MARPKGSKTRPPLKPEQRDEARRMRAEGMTVPQVAEALRLSESQVRRATIARDAKPSDAAGTRAEGLDWARIRAGLGFYAELATGYVETRHLQAGIDDDCVRVIRSEQGTILDAWVKSAQRKPGLARFFDRITSAGDPAAALAFVRIAQTVGRNHVFGRAPMHVEPIEPAERVPSYAEEHDVRQPIEHPPIDGNGQGFAGEPERSAPPFAG